MRTRFSQAPAAPELVADIEQRLVAGGGYREIARELGRTEGSVRGIAERRGIARHLNKSRGPSDEELQRLRKLLLADMPRTHIAAEMGRGLEWVRENSARLGLALLTDPRPDFHSHQSPLRTAPCNRAGEHTAAVMTAANDRQCRHVTGEPGKADFTMCMGEVAAGKRYCTAHMASMYDAQGTRAASARAAGNRNGERTTRTAPKQGAGWHGFV